MPSDSHAVTRTWTGGPTGLNQSWSQAGNWNPFGVPAAGDVVIIPGLSLLDTYVSYDFIGFQTQLASLTLNHNNTRGNFATSALSINSNIITLAANVEYLGDSGTRGGGGRGRIDHTGGTNITPLLVLGRYEADTGSYNISGPSHIMGTEARVGEAGGGFFTHSGGLHESTKVILGHLAGSGGTYNLSGGALRLTEEFTIGNGGVGTFNLSGGAQVVPQHWSNSVYSTIAAQSGSTGTATVSGAGSQWSMTGLHVGTSGNGTMNILSGGLVTNENAFVGFAGTAVGTAKVSGAGSTWTNSGGLWIGGTSGTGTQGGTGTLTIEAGGSVSSGNGTIAGSFNSTGTVTVGGVGAAWTIAGDLAVGPLGSPTLNVDPGGTVSLGGILHAGGLVRLRGGTLRAKTFRYVGGGNGTFDWTSGRFEIETYERDLVNTGGTLAPWHSTGFVTLVNGSYAQQAGGSLEHEIGATPAVSDHLRVLGDAKLDGTLHLALVGGFRPQPTQFFPVVVNFGTQTGTFSNISGYAIAPGQDFAVHYTPGAVSALAGEWRDPQLEGIIDVPGANLSVTGSGTWAGTLVKQGTGRMVVDFSGGTSTFTAAAHLNVKAGEVLLLSDVGASAPSALHIHVTGGGLTMRSTQHLAALEVGDGGRATLAGGAVGATVAGGAGGGRVLRTSTVNLHTSGTLDQADNKLIVVGGDVGTFDGTSYSGLTKLIASAYNFGQWDGPGITTTMPDAGPTVGLTTLAINTADDTFFAGGTFGGVSVASGDVLITYTYAGDVNLDGLVDAADYGVIDNWIQFPGTSGYANGDFNYDGVIDAADYGIIDNTIQLQGDPIPANAAALGEAHVSAVPEPASLAALLTTGGAALRLMRRRHRR